MKKSQIIVLSLAIILIISFMFIFNSKNPTTKNQQAAALSAIRSARVGDHLNPVEFLNKSKEPGVTVIDVRTKAEYDGGHIDKAINIDFYDPDFATKLDELDKGRTYLIYCRSGHRSGEALNVMKELGFTDAADLAGGYAGLDQ